MAVLVRCCGFPTAPANEILDLLPLGPAVIHSLSLTKEGKDDVSSTRGTGAGAGLAGGRAVGFGVGAGGQATGQGASGAGHAVGGSAKRTFKVGGMGRGGATGG
jgi:hypothetical protein